jgi:hypothetical protein
MKYELKDEVLTQIHSDFPSEQQQEVVDLVSNADLWCPASGPPARIHIAFLMKSKGDLETLINTIEAYAGDWRDLLIQVGLADENWQQVLVQKGIDPSNW